MKHKAIILERRRCDEAEGHVPSMILYLARGAEMAVGTWVGAGLTLSERLTRPDPYFMLSWSGDVLGDRTTATQLFFVHRTVCLSRGGYTRPRGHLTEVILAPPFRHPCNCPFQFLLRMAWDGVF